MYYVQKQKYREKNYLDYKYICNFKSVHILDSINKCHYNVGLQLTIILIID